MNRPLVSIVTPTWQRHELLFDLVHHLREQDYPSIEHVIVSDGQDRHFRRVLEDEQQTASYEGWPEIVFQQLGRNWSGQVQQYALGVAPILTGLLMARGEYLAWMCDDERFTRGDALTQLVDRLEATRASFVYPVVRMYWNGQQPVDGWDIGTDPPQYGQFTWCLFRTELLQTAMPRFDAPVWNDWDLCSRWLAAGAKPAFLDTVLVSHRADR